MADEWSDSRRRVLEIVAQLAADEPVQLAEVAESLGGHSNTARHHLEALVKSGDLVATTVPSAGRGRPPRAYAPTEQGLATLRTLPTDPHAEIIQTLAEVTVGSPEAAVTARALGEAWGRRRAANAEPGRDGWDLALESLEALGFAPATDPSGETWLRACPMLALARTNPEFACTLHESMVQSLLQATGATESAVVAPRLVAGGCRLQRLPRRPARSTADQGASNTGR